VELAAALVMLPPPWLPYQNLWLLHYTRQLKPFKQAGALALVHNERFRYWLHNSGVESSWVQSLRQAHPQKVESLQKFRMQIHSPLQVPDDRIVASFLRSHVLGKVARWLAPHVLLVDFLELYWNPTSDEEYLRVVNEPLRKWVSHGYPLVERDPRRIRETYEEED
jgi:hypothetical protein